MTHQNTKTKTSIWQEYKGLAVFLLLMFCFRSAIADWNAVPTGSMLPTIVQGDRILVNKMAYDIRVPFTHHALIKLADPKRGDIIVFDSKAADKRLVKRVIGLPGDQISMRANILSINGHPLNYTQSNTIDSFELLPGNNHAVRRLEQGKYANFAPISVPAKHYLVLGDNRDNSADSRVIGFVPREEIVGQTKRVVMSLNYDHFYLPRSERFLKML